MEAPDINRKVGARHRFHRVAGRYQTSTSYPVPGPQTKSSGDGASGASHR